MADSQDLLTMWQLRLGTDSDARISDAGLSVVDPNSAPTVLRIVRNPSDDAYMISQARPKDSRQCFAEFVVGKGSIQFTTKVADTSITPHSGFGAVSRSSFAVQKSTKTSTAMVYLRPGDAVYFGTLGISVTLERPSSPSTQSVAPAAALTTNEIEVRSSGHEAEQVDGSDETESEDEDDIGAATIRPESQATMAPFSTAHSTLQVVQETPKAERTVMLPEEASKTPKAQSPVPEVLTASKSANNRGRKRALVVMDGEASLTSSDALDEQSKRRKTTEEPSSSRRSSKGTPATTQQSKQEAATARSGSSTRSASKPLRVVFSGVTLTPEITRFLKKQKVTVAADIAAKSGQATTICCVLPGKLSTTAKVLTALVHNLPIVHLGWIEASLEAGEMLNPAPYRIEDLPEDVDRSVLFAKRDIYFTQAAGKSYAKGFSDIVKILQAAGSKKPTIRAAGAIESLTDLDIIIGLEKNDDDAATLLSKGERVYMKELLNASILQGELLVEDPSLQLSYKDVPPKKGRKKT